MATTALRITNDFIFRYIFSRPENSDLLLDLVNTVLEDNNDRPLLSLEVTNPVDLRSAEWIKEAVLDIRARDQQGAWVDVEIQLWEEPEYQIRSLYYWAQTFATQLEKGEFYEDLVPVVCINFLGFKLFQDEPHRHTCFTLREHRKPHIELTKHLVLHFIEMPKLDHDGLSVWLRLMGMMVEGYEMSDEDKALLASNPVYGRVKQEFDKTLQNRQARELAMARDKFRRDQMSREKRAHDQGLAAGKLETARAMLDEGVPLSTVMKATGFSEAELRGTDRNKE